LYPHHKTDNRQHSSKRAEEELDHGLAGDGFPGRGLEHVASAEMFDFGLRRAGVGDDVEGALGGGEADGAGNAELIVRFARAFRNEADEIARVDGVAAEVVARVEQPGAVVGGDGAGEDDGRGHDKRGGNLGGADALPHFERNGVVEEEVVALGSVAGRDPRGGGIAYEIDDFRGGEFRPFLAGFEYGELPFSRGARGEFEIAGTARDHADLDFAVGADGGNGERRSDHGDAEVFGNLLLHQFAGRQGEDQRLVGARPGAPDDGLGFGLDRQCHIARKPLLDERDKAEDDDQKRQPGGNGDQRQAEDDGSRRAL